MGYAYNKLHGMAWLGGAQPSSTYLSSLARLKNLKTYTYLTLHYIHHKHQKRNHITSHHITSNSKNSPLPSTSSSFTIKAGTAFGKRKAERQSSDWRLLGVILLGLGWAGSFYLFFCLCISYLRIWDLGLGFGMGIGVGLGLGVSGVIG